MPDYKHIYSVNDKQLIREIGEYVHIIDYCMSDSDTLDYYRSKIYKDDAYLGFIRYDYGKYSSRLGVEVEYDSMMATFKEIANLIINL